MVSLVLIALLLLTLALHAAAYLLPPKRSFRALRARLADLEDAYEVLDRKFASHLKRYRSLEGSYYRTDDDEQLPTTDPPPPVGIAPSAPPAQIDFPEEEFRSLIAARSRINGGLHG